MLEHNVQVELETKPIRKIWSMIVNDEGSRDDVAKCDGKHCIIWSNKYTKNSLTSCWVWDVNEGDMRWTLFFIRAFDGMFERLNFSGCLPVNERTEETTLVTSQSEQNSSWIDNEPIIQENKPK